MRISTLASLRAMAIATTMAAFALPAAAQTANPLQPRSTSPAPAVTAPAATVPAATAPAEAKPAVKRAAKDKAEATTDKPKRERSAGQLANDDRMRKCGAEWRAGKEKLTSQGYNWIKFSTECRARLKAAGQ